MSTSIPLGYLDAAGPRSGAIVPLTWFMLLVSVGVCVIIGVLLWQALRRAVSKGGADETRAVPVARGPEAGHWIRNGLLLSALPLLAALVWTMVTLASVSGPPYQPGLTLDVTGHQWWWEVTYAAADPSQQFTTANEIHIPVGSRVLVRLHGADVIHSFWVPKLSGKTDVIPGQTNVSWMEAREPGIFFGQCSEYCGLQHAHMALQVIAEPPEVFQRWRTAQLQDAAPPREVAAQRGLALVEYRCGLCHQVRGTTAGAHSAPDLTHLATRRTLAAGVLPNGPVALARWIENAQGTKPGNLMPNQNLAGDQLTDVIAYLETLR
jgi:cytochrome c oxidase subunit 2